MNGERLVERRKWFRVFPEGTLEFMIITRVLALMMLMALAIVGGTQRPLVLVGLIGILWVDYALLLWWVVQVAADLRLASDQVGTKTSDERISIFVKALLPSIPAALVLVPWDGVLVFVTGSRPGAVLPVVLPVVAAIAFVVLCWPAVRALADIGLGSALWRILLLIPLLHFFAMHRIAYGLDARIHGQLRLRDQRVAEERGSAALLVADVTWVLSILPWAVVVGVALLRGWPASGAFRAGPVCGTMLAALFAIANLAALESVQRQLVALLRKA